MNECITKKINGEMLIGYFNEESKKFFDKLKIGEYLQLEIKEIRNYQQLKMLWAVCDMIAQNITEGLEHLDSKKKVMEYMKLRLGYIDYMIQVPDKTGQIRTHLKTKSISFDKMSQSEADKFTEQFMILAEKILEVSRSQIHENIQYFDSNLLDDR
jgi:hypothetical protein